MSQFVWEKYSILRFDSTCCILSIFCIAHPFAFWNHHSGHPLIIKLDQKGWLKSIILSFLMMNNNKLMNHNSHKTSHTPPPSKFNNPLCMNTHLKYPHTATHAHTHHTKHARNSRYYKRWNSFCTKIFCWKICLCLSFTYSVFTKRKRKDQTW